MVSAYFCIMLMALISIAIVFEAVGGKPIIKKQFSLLLIVFVFLGAYLVYFIEPPQEWDLYAHFKEISRIAEARKFGIQIKENYASLPGTTALFRLVSYLPSVHFLPAIAVSIDGLIIVYIVLDYQKRQKVVSVQNMSIAFLIAISYINITLCISGVRNCLACCIAMLGFYIGIFRRRRVLSYILYFIACFIHPACIVLLVLYVANQLLKRNRLIIKLAVLAITPLITFALQMFSGKGLQLVDYARRIWGYYEETEFQTDIRITIVQVIALTIFFIYACRYSSKETNDKRHKEYFELVQIQILATYGGIVNPIFFNRMLYPIGIMLGPMIYMMLSQEESKKKRRIKVVGFTVLYSGLLLYHLYELYNALAR